MTSGQITFLERTQTHPDKGRSDIAPIIVVLDPGWIPIVFKQTCMYIFTYILVPIFTYIIVPVTNGIVYCVIGIFHLIKSLSETLMLPQIYEWGYGVVRAV